TKHTNEERSFIQITLTRRDHLHKSHKQGEIIYTNHTNEERSFIQITLTRRDHL
ncbi:predicted protein, partial [Nematostella vectensis]